MPSVRRTTNGHEWTRILSLRRLVDEGIARSREPAPSPPPLSWDARRTRRARRAQARHPRTPPSSLLPILYFARRAQARQPRTTLSSLLPTLYFTNRSPLHSVHALPSPPFSLLSIIYCHTCDKPPVSCDDAWQMPLRMRTCLRTRVVRRFPRLSTGYMSMRLWPWP